MNYYKYYRMGIQEKKLRDSFKAHLDSRLTAKLNGQSSGATKQAIKKFVESCGNDLVDEVVESLQDGFADLDRAVERFFELKHEHESLEDDIAKLKHQKETLLAETAELDAKFSDPKAREAFRLFTEVLDTGKKDNGYERCRRITAAGAIASAYLGLTRYGGGITDNDDNEKE